MQLDFKGWLFEATAQYIDSGEYAQRLANLKWRCQQNGSHWTCLAPDKVGRVTWSDNNWEKNWQQVARDLFQFAKGGRGKGGYSDLRFVWQNPFVVPPNFDYNTQSEKSQLQDAGKTFWVSDLMKNPESVLGYKIFVNGDWKQAEDIGISSTGMGIDVMFKDGDVQSFYIPQKLTVKE